MIKVPEVGSFIEGINIIEADLGPMKINRSQVNRFSRRPSGSVRLSCGLYYSGEEFQERKQKVLSASLP